MISRASTLAVALALAATGSAQAKEAKLTRYPHFHEGKVAFSYLGDVWTAGEDGKGLQRLTAHKARDVYPRFSPDGKTIAFSSDRNGNLDVFLIPAEGGAVKEVTTHSADDRVLGWSPDGKSVLFASQRGEGFMPRLYTVAVTGGLPRDAGPDMGVEACFSPDGQKIAVNRKAQSYWRKSYRGSYQSDVTVMDLASKTFKDVATSDGMDSWPMWSKDGHIYFVSDREGNGLSNLFRVPEGGGEAEKVTSFNAGDVRFPAMSADGKTIVFEHDFSAWKLDLASKQAVAMKFDISAETQENLTEYRDFNSEADDYALAPDGKRVAFSIRGEVFTAPTDEGDLVQITDGAARDQNVEYSPDGKSLSFVSDQTGREEIFAAPADGVGETRTITDLDALKTSYVWSPDSKKIAFTTADGKLMTVSADGKDQKEVASAKHGGFRGVAWSPDAKWLVYSRPDSSQSGDLYLLPSDGGDEKKITFDPGSEMNPRFSDDGKKVYFTRMDMSLMTMGQGDRPESNLFVIYLEKQDKDPEEASNTPSPRAGRGPGGGGMPMDMIGGPDGGATPAPPKPKEVKIDWAGLKRRTVQVTRTRGMTVTNYLPAHDSKTLIFVASEGAGPTGGSASLYSIGDDGKKMARIASGTPAPADSADGPPGRGGRGGFGGGRMSNLSIPRDGRTVYFQEGNGIFSVPMTGGGGGSAPASMMAAMAGGGGRGGMAGAMAGATASPGGDGSRKKIAYVAKVKIDKPAEWREMFDDAWRTMKYRFYDAKMHNTDWDSARAKYKPLVEYVGDRYELLNLVNEMIGELNASHTGAAPGNASRTGPSADAPPVQTGHLGFDLVADDASGLYKVGHVYEDGPADKDWTRVARDNFLVAFNGKPIKAGDDYWELLNRRLNRKVELTLNDKPGTEGSWKVRIEPIASAAYANLVYEKWVKDRRDMADKLSNGRVGYLHIKAMDQPSLARFKKDLAEFKHKEALVIDQRFNGGGNIEQELLAILVQRPYQVWQPRGSEPSQRPFAGYFGPKVVLQNWRSASNAEMFPAGFRALGLGKVIGTPTMGAVIGTGSYSLIDGSTVRTPGVGVYLADSGRTNMENNPVKPDISVENSPEDNLAGRDPQLETGVRELLKQLPPAPGAVAEKE